MYADYNGKISEEQMFLKIFLYYLREFKSYIYWRTVCSTLIILYTYAVRLKVL